MYRYLAMIAVSGVKTIRSCDETMPCRVASLSAKTVATGKLSTSSRRAKLFKHKQKQSSEKARDKRNQCEEVPYIRSFGFL